MTTEPDELVKFDLGYATLQKIRFHFSQLHCHLHDLRMEEKADVVTQGFLYDLEAFLWGRKVCEDVSTQPRETSVVQVHRIPASWWDHLKRTLIERFPWINLIWRAEQIQTVLNQNIEEKHAHYHVCPHINQDARNPVHLAFMTYDQHRRHLTADIMEQIERIIEIMKNNPYPPYQEPPVYHEIRRLERMLEGER